MENDNLFFTTKQKLMEEDLKDGFVTEDEMEIINQVKVDADQFQVILTKALADGIISENEKSKLLKLRSLIIERAITIVDLEGGVKGDEKALLGRLTELINIYYQID